ncbi:histidine kinase [Thermodesulfobacteriota bacterium]
MFAIIIAGDILGIAIGMTLGFIIVGIDLSIFLNSSYVLKIFFISFLIGLVITYFFFSRGLTASKEALIQEERINRLNMEKKAVETNLQLLQAQIEPHFLFNTLSNILSLLDSDLEKGKAMLNDLMQYLRTTLSKTRNDITTIGEELKDIGAYLNIFKIRMGHRLQYHIDIPGKIKIGLTLARSGDLCGSNKRAGHA